MEVKGQKKTVGELLIAAKSGDFQALGKLLTLVERGGPNVVFSEKELISLDTVSLRLGITGPPGAGKSTLVGKLISEARSRDLKVAVLAVDPSSPFTKGAILADRVRYSEHYSDENVFIRSLGSRGSLGGLCAASYLMLRVFDAVGFDVVFIETVGVGQTELEIINVADTVAVTLVPESGDSIQAMKAGLLEIADLFIVNKSDRPGADSMINELKSAFGLAHDKTSESIEIYRTIATTGEGVGELFNEIYKKDSEKIKKLRLNSSRLQAEAKALLRDKIEKEINQKVSHIDSLESLGNFF